MRIALQIEQGAPSCGDSVQQYLTINFKYLFNLPAA